MAQNSGTRCQARSRAQHRQECRTASQRNAQDLRPKTVGACRAALGRGKTGVDRPLGEIQRNESADPGCQAFPVTALEPGGSRREGPRPAPPRPHTPGAVASGVDSEKTAPGAGLASLDIDGHGGSLRAADCGIRLRCTTLRSGRSSQPSVYFRDQRGSVQCCGGFEGRCGGRTNSADFNPADFDRAEFNPAGTEYGALPRCESQSCTVRRE
jgi:hypothetical protein